jgi:outer membrane protein assembly factor BamB
MYVRAYDLETGRILWEGAKQPKSKRGGLYVYSDGKQLEVYDPNDGHIYLLDAETGQTVEEIRLSLPFFKENGILFSGICGIGLNMNCLEAINAQTGTLLWSHSFGGGVYRWPAFVGDIMFINGAGNLFAIQAGTGDIIWQSEKAHYVTPIVLGGDLLYAIRKDAVIVGFESAKGETVGTIEVSPPNTPPVNSSGYTTYYTIAASNRFVAAYYGNSQELIVFERVENTSEDK